MALPHPRSALMLGAVLVVGQSAVLPADAACPTPPLSVQVTSPLDGETNVPTNVVIDIKVVGDPIPSDIASQFSLVLPPSLTIITTALRVDSNTVSYMTSVQLTPCYLCVHANQTYQIRQGSTLLATFTTGTAPDYAIPNPLTGASATVNGFDSHPDGGSDCIQDRIRQLQLAVPQVGKPVVYTIKEGSQVISALDSSLQGSFYCSGQPHWQGDPSWVVLPGQHTIQVSAVDRAGNSSTSVDLSFNASCDGGTTDGGGGGGGGSGGPGGGSTPVQPTTTSCGCGSGVSGAIALGGLAMILRAQRRNHPRRSSQPA
jgi:hypothetical protein